MHREIADLNTSPSGVAIRFNTNGSLDTSFGGSAGYVTLGWPDGNRAVAVQSDGRIVVGGNISLARLKTDGTPDVTFGSGGIAPLTNGVRSMTIQADGKIVVAGYSSVARYNGADGSLDSSFGVNGVAVVAGVSVTDVALEPDGRIVVAGTAYNGGIFSFALARFLAAGPQIGSFTASPSPVTAGSSVTLTAANIQDLNPGASVTQLAFYQDANGDGMLQTNTDTFLGYGVQTSPGVWAFTFSTSGLPSGTYTWFAQARDSFGVFGDPLAITETVTGDPLAITAPVN